MKVIEAKHKVCPFMGIGAVADSHNFRNGGLVEIFCIVSDCMAWEYTTVHRQEDFESVSPSDSNRMLELSKMESIVRVDRHEDSTHAYFDKLIPLDEDKKEGYCKRIGNDR